MGAAGTAKAVSLSFRNKKKGKLRTNKRGTKHFLARLANISSSLFDFEILWPDQLSD